MELSSHQKLINELRSPVERYIRMMQEQQRQKKDELQSAASVSEEESELMRELETKFDELFGPLNDDD